MQFSVSMCVYGKDNPIWFREAVQSVLTQTCPPDEVVLVVDGPVPETLDQVISELETVPMFKVLRLEQNVGHGMARRTGLEHCTFPLVALMDADDICLPDRFEKQIAMFEQQPQLAIVGGNIEEFLDTTGQVVARRIVPQTDSDIKEYMKTRCPFNQMTVMFRKARVEAAGGYLDWFNNEDYYLWIRMYLQKDLFANLPDVLVKVRVGSDMYKRRGGLRYFKSEARLQRYLRKNRIINLPTYASNVAKRFVVQVLLPNTLRGWVFKRFARKSVIES